MERDAPRGKIRHPPRQAAYPDCRHRGTRLTRLDVPDCLTPPRAAWLAAHVLPHEPALRAWLGRRREWAGEIDDLIQEAYAVLATLESVAHIHNPKAYFFQTAYSLALQQLRRDRVVSIEAVADIEQLPAAALACSTEEVAAGREELRLVAEAIGALPAQCGEVFRLRKIDGLSQRDVAARLGLAESTVEKHMSRAIRTLMDWFGRGGAAGVAAPPGSATPVPGRAAAGERRWPAAGKRSG